LDGKKSSRGQLGNVKVPMKLRLIEDSMTKWKR